MNVPMERRILIAFLLAITSLGAISASTYRSTGALLGRMKEESLRKDALARISEILSLSTAAETALDSYAATGDEEFIGRWTAAEERLNTEMEMTEPLIAATPGQSERLARLRALTWEMQQRSASWRPAWATLLPV